MEVEVCEACGQDLVDGKCSQCNGNGQLTVQQIDQKILSKVLKGQVFDTGHIEHVYDNVLREFGGITGYAEKLRFIYEQNVGHRPHIAMQALKLIKEMAVDADKSRRADREYELVETQDLMRVAGQAMKLLQQVDEASSNDTDPECGPASADS